MRPADRASQDCKKNVFDKMIPIRIRANLVAPKRVSWFQVLVNGERGNVRTHSNLVQIIMLNRRFVCSKLNASAANTLLSKK